MAEEAHTAYALACTRVGVPFSKFVEEKLYAGSPVLALNGSQTPLFNRRISDQDVAVIQRALAAEERLGIQHFDLSRNKFSATGMEHIRDILLEGSTCGLDLSAASLGEEHSELLADLCARHPGLVALLLAQNELGDVACSRAVRALSAGPSLSSLRYLDLARADHGNRTFVAVGQLLARAPVAFLRVASPLLRTHSAFAVEELCKGLRKCQTLCALDVGACRLSDDDVSQVLMSLLGGAGPCPLAFLDLRSNNLSLRTGEHLASYLRCSAELATVVLDGNQLRNRGVNALARALMAREGDIALSLRRNRIGGQGLTALALLCRHTAAVRYLAVEGNPIEREEGPGGAVWDAPQEWEETAAACAKSGRALPCDFGFTRNQFGERQFFRAPLPQVEFPRAAALFE